MAVKKGASVLPKGAKAKRGIPKAKGTKYKYGRKLTKKDRAASKAYYAAKRENSGKTGG